jgi:hypothetical protein
MKDLVDQYTDITRRIKNLEETQSALAAQQSQRCWKV